jgi:adenylate kinase
MGAAHKATGGGKRPRIVLLGPPASGKGTVATELSVVLGVPHVSTGQVFRDAMRKGGPVGESARRFIDKGQLVPDEIAVEVVRMWLDEHGRDEGFIFDGFPRTVPQAEAFDRLLAERGIPITMAILLELSEAEIIERILGRLSCEKCGAQYHVTRVPPKREGICDRCGGKLIRRADDTQATVLERLHVYQRLTLGVIDHYERLGVLRRVSGSGLKDQAFAAIMRLVKP